MCRIEKQKSEIFDTEFKGFTESPYVPQAIIQLMPLENVQISDLKTRFLIFSSFIVRYRVRSKVVLQKYKKHALGELHDPLSTFYNSTYN